MGTARKFVNDESGMTLALAMMMILLIGVMGAGLLTFVSSDLNTVIEQNRGQRAFEVADAGIEAAKRQLASNVDRTKYDDPTDAPVDDIQWSKARGGLTLNNLDGDATTSDTVNVTIQFRGSDTDDFRVISTGTYGDPPRQAVRRIEAIFQGIQAGGGGGENVGHPLYYTPSSISLDGPNINVDAISMFAGKDILIEGVANTNSGNYTADVDANKASFVSEYESSGGTLQGFNGKRDALCDWNSQTPYNGPNSPNQGCFINSSGPYNTWGRTITTGPEQNRRTDAFLQPGFAAEGKICGFPDNSASQAVPPGTCTSPSAADGVYGYDCTTGPVDLLSPLEGGPCADPPYSRGNQRTYVLKDCDPVCPNNTANTVSPPFPILRPNPPALKAAAQSSNSYFVGTPSNNTWGLDQSNASNSRVAFVDAQNQTLTWNPSVNNPGGGAYKGMIVVWCGRLLMDKDFEGIILNLTGENLSGNTQCNNTTATPDVKTVGTYENRGHTCNCWVYADGGTSTLAGIQIDPNSTLSFRPSQEWSFQSNLFVGPPPTDFRLRNWRELYQASP